MQLRAVSSQHSQKPEPGAGGVRHIGDQGLDGEPAVSTVTGEKEKVPHSREHWARVVRDKSGVFKILM